MGDKGSQIRIFLADTGEEVAMAKDTLVHLSPTEEPEQEPSAWSPHGYEITGTLATTPEESEQFRKFIESMKFSRKELRKMFHAVTHGGAIVFQSYFNAEYDNGETEEFVRNRMGTRRVSGGRQIYRRPVPIATRRTINQVTQLFFT